MPHDDKWPLMCVRGAPVTLEQAGEVIRRTDRFFTDLTDPGGNDRDWNQRTIERLHLPDRRHELAQAPGRLSRFMAQIDQWRARWGVVHTQYVHNDWLSTAGHADGWCRPDGHLQCAIHIGKWPSSEDVLDDWREIARAFPFLDLIASVFCDLEEPLELARPSESIVVRGGEATLVVPGIAPDQVDARFGDVPELPERAALRAQIAHAECTGDWSAFADRPFALEHATLPDAWMGDWERVGAQIDREIAARERGVREILERAIQTSGSGDVDGARALVRRAIGARRDEGDAAWIDVLVREIDVESVDERVSLQVLSSTHGMADLPSRWILVRDLQRQIERRRPDPADADRILAPFL